MNAMPEPIPAATLVLMRPSSQPGSPPDLLMMERTQKMTFAAGALVFPGGRIEADDHATAAVLGEEWPDAVARIASIRETIEETGIAPALTPCPGPEVVAAIREALAREEPFAALLDLHGLALNLGALTHFAHWCPAFEDVPRRFDTHFYLAEAPENGCEATVDPREATRVVWMSAAEVIEAADAGNAHIIFPTRRNLERLALFSSHEEGVAHARAHPVQMVVPWFEERDGGTFLCIPEALGYPITSEPIEGAMRG